MAVEISKHDKKFDRQLRLWGAHGQELLEGARICVLGSGPLAAETLKNLVLPNVGQYTIVDDAVVAVEDCGNNFFVTQDDIGKPRCEILQKWLHEMNDQAKGSFNNKSYKQLIEADLKYFDSFTLVIATQLFGELNDKLAKYLYGKNIPYINTQINGLLGYLRIQYQEIAIMETHHENDRTDFYIHPKQLENFKELRDFCFKFNIDTADVEEHAHLPCVALLAQLTKQWMDSHNGELPKNAKEQEEFKRLISIRGTSENYDEALKWAFQCYYPPRVDQDVEKVLKDEKANKLDEHSKDYWILVRALKDFMQNEGKGFLPVSTNIPDITTRPETYVTLKQIYKVRYEKDVEAIKRYVEKHLESIKRKKNSISDEVISRFVKSCRALKVIRTKSIEVENKNPDLDHLNEQYEDWDTINEGKDEEADNGPPLHIPKLVHWYWTFQAANDFYKKQKRLPDVSNEPEDDNQTNEKRKDSDLLAEILREKFKAINFTQEIDTACLEEICRYGGSELHNMASFMGGVASQEALKTVLQQFSTCNHTFVYNGIHCSSHVFCP